MIQSNELRIGNYVKLFGHDFKIELDTFYDMDGAGHHMIGNSKKDTMFEGIPITSEILEKCGLHKEEEHIFILPNTTYRMWGYSWTMQQYVIGIKDNWIDIHSKSIKYLHQLQNLYFSLTGEELTFKP